MKSLLWVFPRRDEVLPQVAHLLEQELQAVLDPWRIFVSSFSEQEMHSRGVTNTSACTEDGFSLSGCPDRSVFLTGASVTAIVIGCRRQHVMAEVLPKKLSVNTVRRERETT